jgi:hypothetical protein
VSQSLTHEHFLVALRRILRSLARLLIRADVRFDEFADLVRGVYVESAARDFSRPCLPSRERIAAVTGLTRRQVDRYIDRALPSASPTSADLLVEILQKWHTVPEYVGPYGIPRELEFARPAERCFRSLVTLVDPAADPGAALEELRRAGAIALVGDARLRAVSRSLLMSAPASPRFSEHFGSTLSRFAATLEYNMDPRNSDKRLQRRVTADRGLPLELVPEFEKYARSKATEFLLDLDNWLASRAADDADAGGRLDAGVNVFFHMEPPAREEPLAVLVSDSETKANGNG